MLDFDRVVIETTGLADPGPVAQTFFMDDEIAESYLLDSILTLVDAKHAPSNWTTARKRAARWASPTRSSSARATSSPPATIEALIHRLKHMNPRAPQQKVHFGEVPIKDVFDLRGFNLNAKLDIDPDFLKEEAHDQTMTTTMASIDHPSHASTRAMATTITMTTT